MNPPRHLDLYMPIAAALTIVAWPLVLLAPCPWRGWILIAWLPVGVLCLVAFWNWSGQMDGRRI